MNESLETAFIYVDAVKGSDSNPGTSSSPLKTIGAAVNLAETNNQKNVGSRVLINPGTYREAVTVSPPRNSTAMPITFEAVTNGTVVVSGAEQFMGWQMWTGNSSVYTKSWTYNWGSCSLPVGSGAPVAPEIVLRQEMVFVNGTPLTQVLSLNELVVGTFYVDEGGGLVYIWPPTGTDMGTADIEVATQPTLWAIQGQSNIVARGLTFEYANTCRDSAAVVVSGQNSVSNILFDGDSFLWNNAQGLSLNSPLENFTVQNSLANHNGESGFQATMVKNGLYLNDSASYNGWRGAQGAYYTWNASGAHFYQMHESTVTNLSNAYNQTRGIHFDTDNVNVTVNSLTSYENLIGDAMVEVSEGPVTFSNSTMCSESPITGWASAPGFILRDSELVTVTGSTLMNSNVGVDLTGVAGGYPETNWETGQQYQVVNQNFTFTHNIIEGGSGQDLISDTLGGADWTNFVSTLVSNDNTWWNASNNSSFVVPGAQDSFSGWQQATGQDMQSTWAAPSGNPDAACAAPPDMTDFWLAIPAGISPLTIGVQNSAVFTATLVGLSFTGSAQLSYDGVQNIPGAVANWSATALGSNQSANFTATPALSTPAGTYPITLIASSGSLTRTVTVLLTIDPTVQLSNTSLNFGNQLKKNTSSPQSVTVSNSSSAPLSNVSISVRGPNAPDFTETNNCLATLNAQASCTITVTFTPGNTGSRSATVYIYDSDATSPQQVALSGTGTQPVASLAPGSLNFGSQKVGLTTPAQTLTLTNSGTATLTITSLAATGLNTGDFRETNNCGSSLAVNATCTITVTFDPVRTGSRSAKITATDNASLASQSSTLSGTGI